MEFVNNRSENSKIKRMKLLLVHGSKRHVPLIFFVVNWM